MAVAMLTYSNTMIMNLRFSQFVSLLRKGENNYLYNSINGGLILISDEIVSAIQRKGKDLYYICEKEDRFFTYLHDNGYVADEADDKDTINILRYKRLKASFQSQRLSFVIAPTLFCNFKCPYCYEKNLPHNIMKEDIQDLLIDFILQRQDGYKEMEICWHGGEPTMALSAIERILRLIHEKIKLPLVQHSMVTNGYAITDKFISLFKKYPINGIQITVDGDRTTHNENRVSKSGEKTYDKIIENIDRLSVELPETQLRIRMNVHKKNAEQFFSFHEKLNSRWKGRNVYLYPAFVAENENCSVACFDSIEKTIFLSDIYKKLGLKYKDAQLNLRSGLCAAHYVNSWVVDPEGLLYKCWVDVGQKKRAVGNLSEGITNFPLFCKYILGSDKFSDEKCLKCKLLPVCDGGCSRYRFGDDYKTTDQCPFNESEIINFMI